MNSLNECNDLPINNSFDLTFSWTSLFPQDEGISFGGEDLNRDIEEVIFEPKDRSDKNLLEEEKNKFEEVPTSSITILSKKKNSKINSEKKEINPFISNFKDIPNDLSSKVDISKEINKLICDKNNIIKEDKNFHFLNKKREVEINFCENVCIYDNKENAKKTSKKRGRENKDNKRKEHNKMSPDNIIKKIKGKLFKICLNFINNIINEIFKGKKNKLLSINYKYISQLKKEIDLNILDTKLKDLYSKEISPKFREKGKDYNKNIIDSIIIDENLEISDKNTIKFVLDITFKEWLNLYTLKESIDTFCKNKEKNTVDIIKKYIVGLDTFLINEEKKNDKKYFLSFKYHLYNYEKYFRDKKSRK